MQKIINLIGVIFNFVSYNLKVGGSSPDLDVRLLSIVKIGFFASIAPAFIEHFSGWYMANSTFIYFVFIAITIDHVLGSIVHARFNRDWSWKKNRDGLFIKLTGSIFGYILLEMIHQIAKDAEIVVIYLRITMQITVFLYPAFSALKNLNIITGGKFPPKWIFNGITGFNETGDLRKLKIKNNENENLDESVDDLINNDVVNNDEQLPK